MAKKRFQAEQIIGKLREAEVEISKGQTIGQVVKKLGVTEQTYYRWRKEYGGLRTDQAKRLKEQEKQICRKTRRFGNPEPAVYAGEFCYASRRDSIAPPSASHSPDWNRLQ